MREEQVRDVQDPCCTKESFEGESLLREPECVQDRRVGWNRCGCEDECGEQESEDGYI